MQFSLKISKIVKEELEDILREKLMEIRGESANFQRSLEEEDQPTKQDDPALSEESEEVTGEIQERMTDEASAQATIHQVSNTSDIACFDPESQENPEADDDEEVDEKTDVFGSAEWATVTKAQVHEKVHAEDDGESRRHLLKEFDDDEVQVIVGHNLRNMKTTSNKGIRSPGLRPAKGGGPALPNFKITTMEESDTDYSNLVWS